MKIISVKSTSSSTTLSIFPTCAANPGDIFGTPRGFVPLLPLCSVLPYGSEQTGCSLHKYLRKQPLLKQAEKIRDIDRITLHYCNSDSLWTVPSAMYAADKGTGIEQCYLCWSQNRILHVEIRWVPNVKHCVVFQVAQLY